MRQSDSVPNIVRNGAHGARCYTQRAEAQTMTATPSPSSPRLALVILAVEDLARARALYTALLGWQVTVEAPFYVEMEHGSGQRLGLYAVAGYERNLGTTSAPSRPDLPNRTELYFLLEDPAAAVARALAAGARELSPLAARDWGDEVAYVADPDGNVVALARSAG
jgi:uncharacterized protein